MAQQWLSYVDRAARPVGILGREATAIGRDKVLRQTPFDFTAKFCIIDVPYSRSSTAKIFRRLMSDATIRRCPQCRREASWEDNPWKPFCSERCKMIDLGRWATEEYRVPMTETPDDVATDFDPEVNTNEQP